MASAVCTHARDRQRRRAIQLFLVLILRTAGWLMTDRLAVHCSPSGFECNGEWATSHPRLGPFLLARGRCERKNGVLLCGLHTYHDVPCRVGFVADKLHPPPYHHRHRLRRPPTIETLTRRHSTA
ncbi:hypothetical protein LZ30DRAFT_197888 [Colletotrichum cereale]|nr:hypothetical protein LZ30DRAFT_197888 [Colletotrichum cereale]